MSFSKSHRFAFFFILGILVFASCSREKKNELLYSQHKKMFFRDLELNKELDSIGVFEEITALEISFSELDELIEKISQNLILETRGFAFNENGVSSKFNDPNNKYRVIHIMVKQGYQAKLNALIGSFSESFASQKERFKIAGTLTTPFVEKLDYPELKLRKEKGVSFEGLDMLESQVILFRLKNEALEAFVALKRDMKK